MNTPVAMAAGTARGVPVATQTPTPIPVEIVVCPIGPSYSPQLRLHDLRRFFRPAQFYAAELY